MIKIAYDLRSVFVGEERVFIPDNWELVKCGDAIQANDKIITMEYNNGVIGTKILAVWGDPIMTVSTQTSLSFPAIRKIK